MKIGLIAGKGCLPAIWARAARKKGNQVYAFLLQEVVDYSLEGIANRLKTVKIGELDKLLRLLLQEGIKKVVMIGKVEKSLLFQEPDLDERMQGLLSNLRMLNDDAIMLALISEFEKEGIEVIKQSTFIEDLFPEPGLLTSDQPGEKLLADMKYGFRMAREIGRLDIGQTVVVKDRTVLAVEAIEGTDAAIRRGGALGGPGVVVAKAGKPQQDWRFDLPTIGMETLNNLIAIRASGLIIEAGKAFLLDREEIIKKAEKNGISILSEV